MRFPRISACTVVPGRPTDGKMDNSFGSVTAAGFCCAKLLPVETSEKHRARKAHTETRLRFCSEKSDRSSVGKDAVRPTLRKESEIGGALIRDIGAITSYY